MDHIMTPVGSDRLHENRFGMGVVDYQIQIRGGGAVHEAFQNALPVEYTAGDRKTFHVEGNGGTRLTR